MMVTINEHRYLLFPQTKGWVVKEKEAVSKEAASFLFSVFEGCLCTCLLYKLVFAAIGMSSNFWVQ